MKMIKNETLVAVGMLVLGLVAPLMVSPVWVMVLGIFFFYAILAISWNIVFGYAGLFSFGHVAFSAVGGYTSAMLAENAGLSPLLGLLMGGVAAGCIGILIGVMILRVHGFYLCLVTWAFSAVVNVIIKAEHGITGGTGGFIAPPFFEGPQSEIYSYFVGLGLMILMFVVSVILYHSRWGLYLFAIRDDIEVAETMGVDTRFWKVSGFAFGSAWAGVAGAYYAHFFSLVDPSIGGLDEMGKTCLMVIIGGIGTVFGPLIGSFFVVILSELIRGSLAELSLLIFAVVMILTMRFVRGGFMEMIQIISPRLQAKYLKLIGKGSQGSI
jgi:branched-chain amino acid transport system permease protein